MEVFYIWDSALVLALDKSLNVPDLIDWDTVKIHILWNQGQRYARCGAPWKIFSFFEKYVYISVACGIIQLNKYLIV